MNLQVGDTQVEKLDSIAASLGRVEQTVAELSAWVKSERERVNRIDAFVATLTIRHEDDIRNVYRALEPLATRADLDALEKDLITRQRWIIGLAVPTLVSVGVVLLTLITT